MLRFETSKNLSNDAIRIRTDVFVKEQGFEVEFDEKDADSYHMLVYDDDVPIAVCRFMPGEGSAGGRSARPCWRRPRGRSRTWGRGGWC